MPTKSKPAPTRRSIPIIDLGGEYLALKKKIDAAISRVLASGSYILGEETQRLEADIAAYCGVRHGIGVNSGTDAILIALRALDIGPGDEVIVPSMTFIATAEPVVQLGGKPVFADIDSNTYNIDPARVESAITPRTKAIIAVHLYGQPADLKALTAIADAKGIPLIEDMAQALGAEYNGKKVGGFGRMACISFYPTKNLGAYGDAGMVLTSDDALARRLRGLRNHGAQIKYHHDENGYNTRLDEVQAAILRVKLPLLDAWNKKRMELAQVYSRTLADTPVRLPQAAPGGKHIFHLYSICTPQRDALQTWLSEQGISSATHYPKPLHLQTAFKSLGGKPGDYPNGERLARETLSLPLYPQLTSKDIASVSAAVTNFFQHAR
jgi:dTDP-4-amino-4,6-dideoxygalactose transaminase